METSDARDARLRRGAAREDAILCAALDLLAEVGYERMTMDAVAARARSSKATMYRRWPGKADLVVSAVSRYASRQDAAPPDTGSLREDLLVTLRATRDGLAGQDADLILGLLTAMRRDPNIAATVRSRMVETKLAAFAPAVRAAQERGEVPADADHRLVAEVGSAMLFSRGLLTGAPLDDDFLQHLVDEVLVPVLTAPRRDPAC